VRTEELNVQDLARRAQMKDKKFGFAIHLNHLSPVRIEHNFKEIEKVNFGKTEQLILKVTVEVEKEIKAFVAQFQNFSSA